MIATFGIGWEELIVILVVGVFVLGPERIPVAVRWVAQSVQKLRGMAASAQSDLRREIGPELDELRRQVADLQSLKEFQDLRSLRDISPKRFIQKQVLGDEFSGGVKGFLGLEATAPAVVDQPLSAADLANAAVGVSAASAVAAVGLSSAAVPARRLNSPLAPGELAPFDPDGT